MQFATIGNVNALQSPLIIRSSRKKNLNTPLIHYPNWARKLANLHIQDAYQSKVLLSDLLFQKQGFNSHYISNK